MVSGIFHVGSGIGNQLFRYVATRVLALDKNTDFSMVAPELFKGHGFMRLNMGNQQFPTNYKIEEGSGKTIPLASYDEKHKGLLLDVWEEKTSYYNPEINFVDRLDKPKHFGSAIIDGEFQSIQYFGHRLDEVDQWLKVEPMDMDYETCVIGFRGGEFALFPELFLPKSYWDEAISIMVDKGVKKFEIHTDDAPLAKEFFKDYPVIHDIGINWRSMRYAKYAIIANSSFFILPRLLNGGHTIAPRYWARHNTKEWSRPDNYYSAFQYV